MNHQADLDLWFAMFTKEDRASAHEPTPAHK